MCCGGVLQNRGDFITSSTGRAGAGAAGRSADAIVVHVRASKCFLQSRYSFSFDSPFEQHVFERLPFDRLGEVVILYGV